MARGRNQNRGRNQQPQNTQQISKNFPLYQQQHPQLLAKTSVKQSNSLIATTANANNTNNTATITTATTDIANSATTANAPVASINKQQNICNKININTTSPSINSESYGHNNNQNKSNNNKNYDDDANTTLKINGTEEDIRTHLETNGDPAKSSTTNTTYQMTMSNNSSENFSQVNEQNDDVDDHNDVSLFNKHSNSANENNSQRVFEKQLNNSKNDEHRTMINRSPVIEQNGSVIADNKQNEQNNNSRFIKSTTHNGKTVNEQLNKLTECDRERFYQNQTEKREAETPNAVMGQKNTKGDTTRPSSSSRSPTPSNRAFRESSIPSSSSSNEQYTGNVKQRDQSPSINVPTITVVDCSTAAVTQNAKSYDSNVTDKEEFYDFENETSQQQQQQQQQEFSDQIQEHNEYYDHNGATIQKSAYGIQRSASPTSMYSRYNCMKLEDVPEQEEEEEEEEEEDDEEDENEAVGENELDEGIPERDHINVYASANNLDNETQFQRKHSNSRSPDRHQHHQKSTNINISHSNSSINNSDYNLSTSFPDSGIGESCATSTNSRFININDNDCDSATSNMQQLKQKYTQHQRMPFVRDGYSTDCDETLMQCDELLLDFVESPEFLDPSSERLVCIESISLPDVVVESTTLNGCNNSVTSTTSTNIASSLSASSSTTLGAERDFININGATGNTINSVHFIPIQVEGGGSGRSSPRKQSVDDSVVGSGKATIEIIEDVTELQHQANSARSRNNSDMIAEKLKTELLEQKTQFNVQLEDAHKNVNNLQTKINDMQTKIEKLEQELSAKTWNVERLQGELTAAHKDDEFVRKKLRSLENEKTNLRHLFSENEDELKRKYDELEIQYNELQEKYETTQSLAKKLHTQLATAQSEAEQWRQEVEKIRSELEEQIKVLKSALESSENERKICEDKWQREFEMLRTHNMDREESIMTDCEWQMRQMQRQCKDKLEKAEFGRKEAVGKVEQLEEELEERRKEIDDLRLYQAQVNSLRSVVSEQEYSIKSLMDQIEHLKSDLTTANDNLTEQIEAVKKIKYHCDNALYDKERQMIYRIDEVRNEAACFWENKLYTEMTRLKNELESVYVDERREALDKLQAEHVEELKALTNRYSDNEEDLRVELAETQERLERKTEEFKELREKSDNALLQTRMHLDRADRDYQKAMCQEEERREALEASLREEFETEKQEMEEKFRERLGQVKDEFSKELQINTQELTEEHQKDIEKLRAKLTAEKDEALRSLTEKHRQKLADVEERIKEVEVRHKRDLKDLKAAYDAEKSALDKRDISNANEIEQLHRKCRCLTNLFEEMRMRYERRDPRAEDLQEISELRTRCESQERDLYLLTDRLREMQIQMNELQQNGVVCSAMNNKNNKKSKQIKKPPPKTIPTNCDVIYEENEERESPPPTQNSSFNTNENDGDDDDPDTDSTGEEDNNDDDDNDQNEQRIADVKSKTTDHQGNVKLLIKGNEDDSHMITAV